MAMAAAEAALMERVEPNCSMESGVQGGVVHFRRQAGTFLAEHQDAVLREVVGFQRHGVGEDVDADDRQPLPLRPRHEVLNGGVVADVLVAVGDHGPATVPPASSNDVYLLGEERVGGPHHGADVEVVLPVLDRDVEVVPLGIQVRHDGLVLPVAVLVHHIAAVPVGQQVRVPVLALGPLAFPGPDADLALGSASLPGAGSGGDGQGWGLGGQSPFNFSPPVAA